MRPRVFRGVGATRALVRLGSLVTLYAGAFAVLWGLGLVVRGWQGWVLLATPLVGLVALRVWAWRRVSVAIAEGVLRYEGASARCDFEVPIERVETIYFDRMLPGEPLVLSLVDGDERIVSELSEAAGRALFAHLTELGIPSVRATTARRPSTGS